MIHKFVDKKVNFVDYSLSKTVLYLPLQNKKEL